MVFGVFDLLHPGHVSFLKQAKKLGNFLVVSVARDVNVKRVKKIRPVFSEKKRLKNLKDLKIADKVVMGSVGDPIGHIKKEKPDIIALGYDQDSYLPIGELQKTARVVRLRPFKPEIFKSSKLRHAKSN